jgi:hypothetical protein
VSTTRRNLLPPCSGQKTESEDCSEAFLLFYQTTRCHIVDTRDNSNFHMGHVQVCLQWFYIKMRSHILAHTVDPFQGPFTHILTTYIYLHSSVTIWSPQTYLPLCNRSLVRESLTQLRTNMVQGPLAPLERNPFTAAKRDRLARSQEFEAR